MTASHMRACARDTASRLYVRTMFCRSAFSLTPPLRSANSAAAEAALFARFPATSVQVRLLRRAHRFLQPPAFPTTSRPRLAGTAMEISRFPCKRLLRMPGSTTTRGRYVSCDTDSLSSGGDHTGNSRAAVNAEKTCSDHGRALVADLRRIVSSRKQTAHSLRRTAVHGANECASRGRGDRKRRKLQSLLRSEHHVLDS
jgi:hypothetical protein